MLAVTSWLFANQKPNSRGLILMEQNKEQKEKEQPTRDADEVLRRMLNTPPVKKKTKKKQSTI